MPRTLPATGAGPPKGPLEIPGHPRAERGQIHPLRPREELEAPQADRAPERAAAQPTAVPRVVLPGEDAPLTPRQEIPGFPVAPWRTIRGGAQTSAARPRAGPGEAWERSHNAPATPGRLPPETRSVVVGQSRPRIRAEPLKLCQPPRATGQGAKAQGEFGTSTGAPKSTGAELTISRTRLPID